MKLTLATYNILHGYHKEKILENIKTLIDKGTDIICIQEAEIKFEDYLPATWGIDYYFTPERGCRLAIAWDKSKLNIKNTNKFLLPALEKPSLLQKLTAYKAETIQRGAFVSNFLYEIIAVKIPCF